MLPILSLSFRISYPILTYTNTLLPITTIPINDSLL